MKKQIPEGWSIAYESKPVPSRQYDWGFSHENHDGENGLCGTASSVDDAVAKIKEIIGDTDFNFEDE